MPQVALDEYIVAHLRLRPPAGGRPTSRKPRSPTAEERLGKLGQFFVRVSSGSSSLRYSKPSLGPLVFIRRSPSSTPQEAASPSSKHTLQEEIRYIAPHMQPHVL